MPETGKSLLLQIPLYLPHVLIQKLFVIIFMTSVKSLLWKWMRMVFFGMNRIMPCLKVMRLLPVALETTGHAVAKFARKTSNSYTDMKCHVFLQKRWLHSGKTVLWKFWKQLPEELSKFARTVKLYAAFMQRSIIIM